MRTPEAATVQERGLTVALCAVGAFAAGAAVQVDNGYQHPVALAWLSVAVLAVLAALAVPSHPRLEALLARGLPLLLVAALAFQFFELSRTPPAGSLDGSPGWRLPILLGVALAALATCGLLVPRTTVRHGAVVAVLMAHLALGVWMIRSSPAPPIDVFVFQRDSAEALRGGANPYAITFPNIYGHSTFYGPGLSAGGELTFGFPYPPLSLLLSTLGEVIGGDVRYAQLIAMTLAGALMAYVRPGPVGGLVAALYLFTPRNLFVLEQSWTEPFLVLFLAATVFCAVRCPGSAPYALGLFLATKQYAVLAVPLALLLVNRPWTVARFASLTGRSLLVVAAVSLPPALLDPGAFLHSVVTLQIHQPFRPDALTYPAWIAGPGGEAPVGAGVAFIAAVGVAGLALWKAPRTPAGFTLGVSAVFLVFFALNKQAFCNYYFFVIGSLCVAVAAAAPADRAAVSADGGPTR
ncbi:hypothetical protein [Pseudonocardia sp. H11422]|uniref:hypothetical protein n=1 Tax=Pseudonocardia sp. H11422 TaxID=2835866 RepID=UPI001BDC8CFC|nr:hypothetical protein [Pseudonocardia sp. H11422]